MSPSRKDRVKISLKKPYKKVDRINLERSLVENDRIEDLVRKVPYQKTAHETDKKTNQKTNKPKVPSAVCRNERLKQHYQNLSTFSFGSKSSPSPSQHLSKEWW